MFVILHFVAMGTQLDKGLEGRLVWNAGSNSSMQTSLNWDRNNHKVNATFQVWLLRIVKSCAVFDFAQIIDGSPSYI